MLRRRVKLYLSLIAVLAVVGGAMSFKTGNPNGVRLYYQPTTQLNCTAPTTLDTVVLDSLGTLILPYYTITVAGPGVRVQNYSLKY